MFLNKKIFLDENNFQPKICFTQKKFLSTYSQDPNFVANLGEEPLKRVELIEYYKTFIPDSSIFNCPLSGDQYLINIDNEKRFMSLGTIDQTFGPRWANVSVPQETVLTLFVLKVLSHQNLAAKSNS